MHPVLARFPILGRGGSSPVLVQDHFNRSDSASTLGSAETGQAWTAAHGTWGVSSGKAYAASDAEGNKAVIDAGMANFRLSCTVRGQISTGGNRRRPDLMFHYLDTDNYYFVLLENGAVQINSIITSTQTSEASVAQTTADDTDYVIDVLCMGTSVKVYVNGVLKITYTLGNAAFAAYTKVGFKVRKASSPTIAARWDNLQVVKA